jgi:hypothetical protein
MWLGATANFIRHDAVDFDHHMGVTMIRAQTNILHYRHGGRISEASDQAVGQ